MNKQSGFTLIELIMVIVILGILAATAIPRFYDLSADAGAAAAEGVAGALAAAAAINYAVNSANPGSGQTVSDCPTTENALEGGLSGTWAIDAGAGPVCNVTDGTYNAAFTTILSS